MYRAAACCWQHGLVRRRYPPSYPHACHVAQGTSLYDGQRLRFVHSRSDPRSSRRHAASPQTVYRALVEAGQLDADPHQAKVIDVLQTTWTTLGAFLQRTTTKSEAAAASSASSSSSFAARATSLLPTWLSRSPSSPNLAVTTPPKGLYLYGTVGTGKTMLMDLFYTTVPSERKRRVHFHAFMLELHARLHAMKHGEDDASVDDPMQQLADQIMQRTTLLCFDELQVVDIADAMILRQLLQLLFERGLVIVATSNRHPTELYLNGIQRQSFLPCIDLLQTHCQVVDLNSGLDYRKKIAATSCPLYLQPIDDGNRQKFERMRSACIGNGPALQPASIKTSNHRTVAIPKASGAVASFTFAELCFEPKSAADYIAICDTYRYVFVDDMSRLTLLHRNEARRWITFIDTAYERKCVVVCLSEVSMLQLFDPNSGGDVFDQLFAIEANGKAKAKGASSTTLVEPSEEAFAFQRSLSRLIQMQSDAWLGPATVQHIKETMKI